MKTIIHVNQHVIRANKKLGQNEPPITVKTYKETRRAKKVTIDGPSQLAYNPEQPLACGAHVWIETESPVTIGE